MESFPVSRHTSGIPRAGIRNPGISACPRMQGRAHGVFSCHSDGGKIFRNRNKTFFLTPFEFNNTGSGIALDSALEPVLSPKAGEVVQLAECSLGFHNAQDYTAFYPNVSSFQRAFAVNKGLYFTHRKWRRASFLEPKPSK